MYKLNFDICFKCAMNASVRNEDICEMNFMTSD